MDMWLDQYQGGGGKKEKLSIEPWIHFKPFHQNSKFIKKSLLPVRPIKQDNDDILFDTNNNVFNNTSTPSTWHNVTEQVDVSFNHNKLVLAVLNKM